MLLFNQKRNSFVISLIFTASSLHAQVKDHAATSAYLEKIRNNEAELTAFMSQMPKGGDLHNHYSGAVYGESYFDWIVEADYCINLQTLAVAPTPANGILQKGWVKFSTLAQNGELNNYRGPLLRLWSSKDYDQVHTDTREDHFFSTFGNFSSASGLNYEKGLNELKTRAKAENVSYIETMLTSIRLPKLNTKVDLLDNKDTVAYYNKLLITLGKNEDNKKLQPVLSYLYSKVQSSLPVHQTADNFNHFIDSLHKSFHMDDSAFTIRYLTYITRVQDPLTCFINLSLCFDAVQRSTTGYLRGVNIVAPEDNPVSMRDYWLHMRMFAFCSKTYEGKVRYAMHAGELTEGYVQPEQLTWHIHDAVVVAGASRIGHGVDIAYEKNCYSLLANMSKKSMDIPVEINLSSNEFILGVKDDRHPILLYKHFDVPIVISTDDPGVSRSSLTEQYVLLAKRYKEISYADIKGYVYNSIVYSFLEEPVKQLLISDLNRRFAAFEARF